MRICYDPTGCSEAVKQGWNGMKQTHSWWSRNIINQLFSFGSIGVGNKHLSHSPWSPEVALPICPVQAWLEWMESGQEHSCFNEAWANKPPLVSAPYGGEHLLNFPLGHQNVMCQSFAWYSHKWLSMTIATHSCVEDTQRYKKSLMQSQAKAQSSIPLPTVAQMPLGSLEAGEKGMLLFYHYSLYSKYSGFQKGRWSWEPGRGPHTRWNKHVAVQQG